MQSGTSWFVLLLCLACSSTDLAAQPRTGVGAAEAIRLENRVRADSLVGHGIDTGTGAFILSESVFFVQSLRRVDFLLNYNSLLTGTPGALGRGWSHIYEAYVEESGGIATVHWDVNRRNRFRALANGNYEPMDESSAYDKLRHSGSRWVLDLLGGDSYEFDSGGKLTSIRNRVGQETQVFHGPSGPNRVYDPAGNKYMDLEYAPGTTRLQYVEDNADRIVYFGYDGSGFLSSVRPPVTMGLAVGGTFTAVNIPDNGSISRTIDVRGHPRMGLVKLITSQIVHSRPSDLLVVLRSPQGTTVQLTTDQPSPWNLGELVLPNFDGEDPNGAWTLTVSDRRAGETGRLTAWRMRFTEPTDPIYYQYGAGGQITAAFDPDGRRIFANAYDALWRIIAQDDGRDDNRVAAIAWQDTANGVIATYTDRTGAASVFEHDSSYRLVRITNPLNQTTRYGYNTRGDRTSITDPLGRTTRITFSAEGYPVTFVNPGGYAWTFEHDGPNLTAVVDPLGKRSVLEYQNNRVTRVKDAECLADTGCAGVRKTWAGAGQMMSNTMTGGGMVAYTWQNGRPVGATHPVSSGRQGGTYDAAGRMTESRDADGNVTKYEYNSAGQTLSQTDPLGNVRRSVYDRRGRAVRVTDALGNVTSSQYDGNGNMAARTNAVGEVTRYEYDGEDRLVRSISAGGVTMTRSYDAAGQLTGVTGGAGVAVRYQYDDAGNHTATFDADGGVIERMVYDERDLPILRVNALGARQATQYDELGRILQQTDAENRTETISYDRNDRPTSLRDAAGRTWSQTYARDNSLLSITDSGSQTVRLEYDPANRLTRVRTPDGLDFAIGYTNRDQVAYEQDGDVTHEYSYDAGRRLTEILRNHGERIQFDRDANGNVTAVRSRGANQATSSVRLRYEYDGLNRVRRFVDGDGNSLGFTYTSSGALAALTYPDGRQVRYVYDAGDRLSEIVDWENRRTRYLYDNKGRLRRIELPNRITQEIEYDAAGRVLRRVERSDTGLIQELRYSYDAMDRPVQAARTPAAAPFQPESARMSYRNGHVLDSFNGSSLVYDSRGSVVRGPLGSSLAAFSYDLSGNLSRAGSSTYTYDEQDRLMRIQNERGLTRFVVNPVPALSQILVRTSPDGTVTRYVWGPGLVYEERGGRIRTYHYDFTGNTVALADDAGAVTATMSYGPWGETAGQTGNLDTPFLYGGLYGLVSDTNGLVHMRYRWYSPQIKRFLSKDSEYGRIGFGGSTNPYGYAGGNPISMNDPDGRILNALGGALLGAVVNVAARVVVSYITTGKPPSWGQIAGAALDGAIVGGALFTCGPPCATFAGAVGSGIVLGGAGGFAGSLLEQGIDNGSLNFERAGVDAAWGAVFGGVGGAIGAGRGAKAAVTGGNRAGAASFRSSRRLTPSIISRRSPPPGTLAPPTRPDHFFLPARVSQPSFGFRLRALVSRLGPSVTETAKDAGKDFVAATGFGLVQDLSDPFLFPPLEAGGDGHTRQQARSEGLSRLTEGLKESFGVFPHWRVYMTALGLTGRPAPNPAPALAVF